MSTNEEVVTNDETSGQQTEEEQPEETPKPAPDKDVPISRFNAYRDAYLREQLGKMQVKDGAETDTALSFLNERAGDDDEGLDEAFKELKIRMRLEDRLKPSYVDPAMNNWPSRRRHVDPTQVGIRAWERISKKPGNSGRWL